MRERRYLGRSSLSRAVTPRKDNYARPDHRVEYQIFGSEYFSNADVKLYFGDIWVDEVTSIAFQLQEEVLPIYGYNSYTFDTVSRGKRVLQGAFAINFTSVGYLQEVIENANAIFYALEQGEQDGIIQPEYYQKYKLTEILRKLGKRDFDQIADEYENAIWGKEEDAGLQLSYSDQSYFKQDQLGFDIRIQYGAVSESHGYTQDRFYQKPTNEKPNITVDVINGVQLNGMSKQISTADQGAPIMEHYTFIARDLNGLSFANLNQMDDSNGTRRFNTVIE